MNQRGWWILDGRGDNPTHIYIYIYIMLQPPLLQRFLIKITLATFPILLLTSSSILPSPLVITPKYFTTSTDSNLRKLSTTTDNIIEVRQQVVTSNDPYIIARRAHTNVTCTLYTHAVYPHSYPPNSCPTANRKGPSGPTRFWSIWKCTARTFVIACCNVIKTHCMCVCAKLCVWVTFPIVKAQTNINSHLAQWLTPVGPVCRHCSPCWLSISWLADI